MHRVGCRVDDAVELAAQVVDRPELRARRRAARTSRSPTSPTTRTPPSSSRASTRCSHAFRARGLPDRASCTRATRPGAIDWPGGALRHGARRHRLLRHRARRRARGPASRCSPAMSVKARVSHVKAVPRGARVSYGLRYETDRDDAHRDRADRLRRRRAPRAAAPRRRGARARPALPDRGHGHDGPADARRRRSPGRGGRRGRADRAPGRRGDHRPRRGRARWAPSPTRSCAASVPAFRACTSRERAMSRAAVWPRSPDVAVGAAAGIAGAGYAGAAAARGGGCEAPARRRRGARARRADVRRSPARRVRRRLDLLVESGEGPPIVLSHGVTNSIRTWFHQLEALPAAGFRTIAFDHRGHGQSVVGSAGHSHREPRRRHAHRRRGARPARRGARRPLDGRRRGAGVRDAVSRDRGGACRGHRAALDAGQDAARLALDAHQAARIEQITEARARHELDVVVAEPRASSSRGSGFGRDPQPSHVELVRQMLRDCPPETRLDAPRALIGLDLTADLPNVPHPDARDRRHQRHAHAARAGAADREADPGRAARGVPGRRAHADARARRRARPADRRLRARGRRRARRAVAERASTSRAERDAGRARGDAHVRDPDRGRARRPLDRRRHRRDGACSRPTAPSAPARCAAARPRPASWRCSSPARTVARVDAVVLAGGSAFGLAAADGVMRFLAERGQGFPTAGGPVPIVPAACVFDLVESGERPARAPTTGYAAAAPRPRRDHADRVGSAPGGARRSASGGAASTRSPAASAPRPRACDDAHVVAFAVVNAVGDVIGDRRVACVAGSTAPAGAPGFPVDRAVRGEARGAATRRSWWSSPTPCSTRPRAISSRRARTTASPGRCGRRTPASTATSRSRSRPGAVEAHLDRLRVVAADVVAEAIRVAPR